MVQFLLGIVATFLMLHTRRTITNTSMYILAPMHVILLMRGFMQTTFYNSSARLRWTVYIFMQLLVAAKVCQVQSLCINDVCCTEWYCLLSARY
ncbi:hypothetical protein J3F84DRAFT_79651 [Trichoderma pleuroticola]